MLLSLTLVQSLYRCSYPQAGSQRERLQRSWFPDACLKSIRRRDVEIICGMLYLCWGMCFITLEMFSSSGCCIVVPLLWLSIFWLASCCWEGMTQLPFLSQLLLTYELHSYFTTTFSIACWFQKQYDESEESLLILLMQN